VFNPFDPIINQVDSYNPSYNKTLQVLRSRIEDVEGCPGIIFMGFKGERYNRL
jgi:hypothetical protein